MLYLLYFLLSLGWYAFCLIALLVLGIVIVLIGLINKFINWLNK